jgi:hypothetical protein
MVTESLFRWRAAGIDQCGGAAAFRLFWFETHPIRPGNRSFARFWFET